MLEFLLQIVVSVVLFIFSTGLSIFSQVIILAISFVIVFLVFKTISLGLALVGFVVFLVLNIFYAFYIYAKEEFDSKNKPY